jgi:hypothetical protein
LISVVFDIITFTIGDGIFPFVFMYLLAFTNKIVLFSFLAWWIMGVPVDTTDFLVLAMEKTVCGDGEQYG